MNNLTDNEQILVSYLLKNPIDFIELNAQEISKRCFVSVSSIYRLCQKLELSGLSELKVQMSSSLNNYLKENTDFDFNFPIKQNQKPYDIPRLLEEDYHQTIQATINLMDTEELQRVAKAMKKAKQIDIYTSAGNLYFAQNFVFQMLEIGVDVHITSEEYSQRLQAGKSNEDNLAIVISFGGRGAIIVPQLKTLRMNKTPVVAITSSDQNNNIEKYGDYCLYLCSSEDHYYKISSFATRLSLLYILDCLYTAYFNLDYEKNMEKKLELYRKLTYCDIN